MKVLCQTTKILKKGCLNSISKIFGASFSTFPSKIMTAKQNYPSADRNKDPIYDVLAQYIKKEQSGTVLEIASGTGQHAAFFAERFPNLTFQPTEYDKSLFESIKAYANEATHKNINTPLQVDIANPSATLFNNTYDYIICTNMIHISPYECTEGLFNYGSKLIKNNGLMITYGAYAHKGVLEPQSNIDFDKSLRSRNPSWGIRDIVDLEKLGSGVGFKLIKIHDMPANNKCLIWEKVK